MSVTFSNWINSYRTFGIFKKTLQSYVNIKDTRLPRKVTTRRLPGNHVMQTRLGLWIPRIYWREQNCCCLTDVSHGPDLYVYTICLSLHTSEPQIVSKSRRSVYNPCPLLVVQYNRLDAADSWSKMRITCFLVYQTVAKLCCWYCFPLLESQSFGCLWLRPYHQISAGSLSEFQSDPWLGPFSTKVGDHLGS